MAKDDSEKLNGSAKKEAPDSNLPESGHDSKASNQDGLTEEDILKAKDAYQREWDNQAIARKRGYRFEPKTPMDSWAWEMGEGWVNVTGVDTEAHVIHVGVDPAIEGGDKTVVAIYQSEGIKGYVTIDPETIEEAERLAKLNQYTQVYFDPVELRLKRDALNKVVDPIEPPMSTVPSEPHEADNAAWLDSVASEAHRRNVEQANGTSVGREWVNEVDPDIARMPVNDWGYSNIPHSPNVFTVYDAVDAEILRSRAERLSGVPTELKPLATSEPEPAVVTDKLIKKFVEATQKRQENRQADSENAKKSSHQKPVKEATYEVAIVTRGTNLSACLSGLLAHAKHRPFPLRIIPGQPISDERTLGWLSLLSKLGCEVSIEYSPMGIGLQRHKALSGITHDVIICLDDDVVVEPVGAFDTLANVVSKNAGFAIPIIRFTQNFTNKGGLDEHTEIWHTVSKSDPRVQRALKAYGKGWLRVFEIGENQETDDLGGSCFALSVEDAHYVADDNLKNWKRFTGEDYYIGKKIGIGTVVSGVYAYHYGQYSMNKWELDTMSEFDKHTDLETHIATLEEINEAENI